MQSSVSAQTGTYTNGKIPIDPARWYQLNNVSNGLNALFDGNLHQNPALGWGLILGNWDAWYPLLPGEDIQIEKIRMYDWQGTNPLTPATIYVVDDQWKRIPIGRFTGGYYDRWVGPNVDSPDVYNLNTVVKNFRYIVINTFGDLPAELEFYGNYKSPAATAFTRPAAPLKNMFGTNGFEWNLINSNNASVVSDKALKLATAFTGFRHYLDWERLETEKGSYTYNPIFSGSWNLDTLYARLKQSNIEVLSCIKNIPAWIRNTYPTGSQDAENSPLIYGADKTKPASYLDQAKLAFQFAARYGSNKSVNPALLSVNSKPRWTGDPVNTIRIGLDLVKYMECNNEPDRWWKGRNAYQTGREYAANLSAFYDGHLGTMGAGVGVKNADPRMKVVCTGTAAYVTDYVRGMIDWCAENRGYLADGSVNLCWDVVNYHYYSNDNKNSQQGNATRGAAPELTGFETVANDFVKMSGQFSKNMPVWLTETGYDIKSNLSTQYAIPIGNKTAIQTQADWSIRSALLAARAGLDHLFFYEMTDDNPAGGQFATSGMINNDSTRRAAADFLYQVNQQFGNYHFVENLSHNPEVDRYEYNNHSMYVAWMPTESGKTMNYDLMVTKMDSASVFSLKVGSEVMQEQRIINNMSSLTLQLSETPVFVLPYLHSIDLLDFSLTASDPQKIHLTWSVSSDSAVSNFVVEKLNETDHQFYPYATIPARSLKTAFSGYSYTDSFPNQGYNRYRLKIVLDTRSYFYSGNILEKFIGSLISFPNPFSNSLTLQGLDASKKTNLRIVDQTGRVIQSVKVNSDNYHWNLSSLADGEFFLIAEDDTRRQMIRINKMPIK